MIKTCSQDHIKKLYNLIASEYTIFSPTDNRGVVSLSPKDHFDSYSLYKFQPIMPPKITLLDNVYDLESEPKDTKTAFFGLHLCDVKALTVLDRIFRKDVFYQSKRADSLIVASQCTPTPNCFCHIFGANRHTGFDIFIQEETNGQYTVFAKTEKGVKYLNQIKAPIKMSAEYHQIGQVDTNLDLSELTRAVNNREAFEDHWQSISNNCFGCGACTAVCPLCYCFDVVDRTNPENGKCHRNRCDDSCFFANFSKISSHDFRPENVDRLYNWYHHKFVRSPLHNHGYLCVGCGRCITACPANLNIKKILSAIDTIFERGV